MMRYNARSTHHVGSALRVGRSLARGLPVVLGLLLLAGCGRNMFDQPKWEVYEATDFYANDSTARPLLEGTVSRERGSVDPAYLTGVGEDGPMAELPYELTMDVLERGQERYNIYCAPCHGYTGDGEGMIVQKGFPAPPSLHQDRLRDAQAGYFVNVITNGFGRMYPYAARVPPEDRWAIAAYIRALQLSQNAPMTAVPEELRGELEPTRQVTNQ